MLSAEESRLTTLNKETAEIKKKIQLSDSEVRRYIIADARGDEPRTGSCDYMTMFTQEILDETRPPTGQRKACFEECDARKTENAAKVRRLKRDVKELQVAFAKARNNQVELERKTLQNQEKSNDLKLRNAAEAIAKLDEDNIRYRNKLDLVRYQSDKQQKKLTELLHEYEELVHGKVEKTTETKLQRPIGKKIVRLENQLERVNMMELEADTVCKKYAGVSSSLKADGALFASSLETLEKKIHDQESEIKRLKVVKKEAIYLRDITRGTLMKQEAEALNTTKQRECVILEYRQKVEDRKLELERLERMIFPSGRVGLRDDHDSNEDRVGGSDNENTRRLEEAFVKLREATGVSKTEEVLDRFLGQKATKDKLRKMRLATEEEKMVLETRRQQLSSEIELQKFAETKDSEQNVEELGRLNCLIAKQVEREENAVGASKRVNELLTEVNATLWRLCDKLRDVSASSVPEEIGSNEDIFQLLAILEEKVASIVDLEEKFDEERVELMDESMAEKLDEASIASANGFLKDDGRPFFPTFPSAPTPAVPGQVSEDEEEVPTRSVLKRQAQLLVDAKSRRKGFNFRR